MTELGFQLYSARNFQPFSDILKKLSAAYYKQVEGYGAMYASLDEAGLKGLRAELDANGLTMPTGHFGLDLLEGDPKKALNIAKVLGVEAIYCPYLMPDQRPTDATGWFAFGKRLQEAGKPFVDAGLTFGWHNHDFEFKALADGSTPQEQIFMRRPGPEVGSGYRLDYPRQCRSACLDRKLWQAHHRRACEGYRTIGREYG